MSLLTSAVLLFIVAGAECLEDNELNVAEGRGKGYKFALLSHFLYVAASKLFILKIVYGYLFYALAIKAWHFFLWLTKYLKQDHHHEYIEHVSYEHDHYHGHHDHGYGDYHHQDFEPYVYQKSGDGPEKYASYQKQVYDADGSYSVKSR